MKKHDLTQNINDLESHRARQLVALGAAIDLLKFLLDQMKRTGEDDGVVAWTELQGEDLIACCEKSGIKFASDERKELFLETFLYNISSRPLADCDVWNIGHLLFHAEEHEDTIH